MRGPTIFEVAARAGVSTSTASRAMNGRGYLSDSVKLAVAQAAEELGYVPHGRARSLRSRRSGVIGVVCGDLCAPRVVDVLRGIREAAEAAGSMVLINSVDEASGAGDGAAVRSMLEQRPDGLIVLSLRSSESDRIIAKAIRSGMPIVLVGRRLPGPGVRSISACYRHGGRLLTEHLVGLGHRRIGFIGAPLEHASRVDRLAGFLQAMALRGLAVRPEWVVGEVGSGGTQMYPGYEFGYRSASPLLAGVEVPTALLARNDVVALGLIQGLRDSGAVVPRDVSVVGFGNALAGRSSCPALTTIEIPSELEGQRAVSLLLEAGGESRPQDGQRELESELRLLVRGSCGPGC